MSPKIIIKAFFIAAQILFVKLAIGQYFPLNIKSKSNLAYLVDIDSNNRNDYLIPYIDRALQELHLADTPSELIFNEVKNLNIILSSKGFDIFSDAYTTHDLSVYNFIQKLNYIKNNNDLLDTLNTFQYLLMIKINIFHSLLEYQFVLSSLTRGDTIFYVPINDTNTAHKKFITSTEKGDTLFKVYKDSRNKKDTEVFIKRKHLGSPIPNNTNYRTSSVFVDPNVPGYKEKLLQALKQVIIEADEKPEPMILTGYVQDKDIIYVQKGKRVHLESLANDKDSPKDEITYSWQITGEKDNTVFFRANDPSIECLFDTKGTYNVDLTVNDGIKSGNKNLKIDVHDRPSIRTLNKNGPRFGSTFYNNTFQIYSFNKTYSPFTMLGFFDVYSLLFYRDTELNGVKIILSTDKIDYEKTTVEMLDPNVQIKDSTHSFVKINKGPNNNIPNGIGYYYYADTDSKGNTTMYIKKKGDYDLTVPNNRYFKINIFSNGIENNQQFRLQYLKLSKFAFGSDISYFFNNKNAVYLPSENLGVSGRYYTGIPIAVDGFFGISFPVNNNTVTLPFDKLYYCKMAIDINLTNTKKYQFSAVVSYFYHPFFLANNLEATYHQGQLGCGFSSKIHFLPTENPIFSPIMLYFLYYQQKSIFNSTGTNFFDLGVRISAHFVKKDKQSVAKNRDISE